MSVVKRLWRADAPLTGVGFLMIAALAASLAGMWLDPRTITGAPAWLKPAKFHASVAIFTLTLAWVFTYLPAWTRTRRLIGWVNAIVFVLELAIIDLQAWRGAVSHFNVSTRLDNLLFTIMGSGIVVQTLSSLVVAIVLWRQVFADRALGWALRLGMAVTIASALVSGALMLRPTPDQVAEARITHRMPVVGAHTVGAPDGGAGLPGIHWSRDHGDLRVSHFLGLHALQALALIVFALPGSWPATRRVRVTISAALSYAALFGILLWQALGGQSIVAPDAATIIVLAVWIMLTVSAWVIAARSEPAAEPVTAY
jgi:hypothetical protein